MFDGVDSKVKSTRAVIGGRLPTHFKQLLVGARSQPVNNSQRFQLSSIIPSPVSSTPKEVVLCLDFQVHPFTFHTCTFLPSSLFSLGAMCAVHLPVIHPSSSLHTTVYIPHACLTVFRNQPRIHSSALLQSILIPTM